MDHHGTFQGLLAEEGVQVEVGVLRPQWTHPEVDGWSNYHQLAPSPTGLLFPPGGFLEIP